MIELYLLISLLGLHLVKAQLPLCSSTTTIKPVGQVTLTCSELTYATKTQVITVSAPASTALTTTATTVFSPTAVTCLSSATTFSATLRLLPEASQGPEIVNGTSQTLPSGTIRPRQNSPTSASAPEITNGPQLPIPFQCPNPPAPFPFPPVIPGGPCIAVEGPFTVTSTTYIETVTVPSVTIVQAAPTTITFTKTSVLPTPSLYPGVKYYQYENTYHYPDKFGQGTTAGYGGGNYETADWVDNENYQTSNLTQNVDFSTPNWPSYDNLNCQLPGQPAPSDCEHWTVVFQGFLFGRETGNYVFRPALPTDNEILVWGGEKAYSSFTNANSDIVEGYVATPDNKPQSGSYSLVEGEFFPVTMIFVNGFGPALNELTITSPSGVVYPTDTLDFFVPPCDGGLFVP